jgi:hypothetical protein
VENRNGLIAAAMATTADGYAEREAALQQAFKAHINTGKMRTSSRNRFRHSRKHRATPSDHANFNEFLDLQKKPLLEFVCPTGNISTLQVFIS